MKRKYQVGGILYTLSQPQQKVSKIIDLQPIRSMVHKPVTIEERPEIKGYEPQYKLKREQEVQQEVQQEETPVVQRPGIRIINPVLSEVKSVISTPTSVTTSTPTSSNESAWNEVWNQFGSQLGLKDKKAYLYLLGQIKHESGDFQHMEEIADGSAYEGRKDLGNIQRGDGKKYKGRGPIQVTGRSNYEKIYNEFFVPNGLEEYDIVNNPELANDPRIGSLLSIGWLTVTNNGKKAIAESNNYNIEALTKAINGGYNGLKDRIRITNDLLKQNNYS